jgi:phosphatidylserine/phosphatidylglycerophosphate/cardiolipin synthase-like enzyme
VRPLSPLNQLRLEPGRNCWRVEHADRAALIVDACDYYRLARQAMLRARSQIFLIGWDVDTRIALVDEAEAGEAPNCLGALITWLVKRRPELRVYILAWDEGMLKAPGRGTTMVRLLSWQANRRISFKFDSSHPLSASHHQKILVIDDNIGFCGGIDITADRWDTRDHKDEDPGRRRPFTGRRYEPWHDTIMAVDAAAARALGDLARKRWKIATGKQCPEPEAKGHDVWPEELKPVFCDVDIAIARTRGKTGDLREVREIEALFLDLVACAERHVYFETQYFASRVVAEAIARRLEEPDGPEFVIVNPRKASGWLDEEVMSPARYQLVKALEARDKYGRFRVYTPVNEAGSDIYVHAKVMAADGQFLRIGSANLNNRSMGLDSECDLLVDGRSGERHRKTIASLQADLIAEHLGVESRQFAEIFAATGSLIAAIDKLRGEGRTLIPFEPEAPNAVEMAIADSELLDPEAPGELFEPSARPGLLSRLGGWRRRRARARLAEKGGGG